MGAAQVKISDVHRCLLSDILHNSPSSSFPSTLTPIIVVCLVYVLAY